MAVLYRKVGEVLRLHVRKICSARSAVHLCVSPSSGAFFDQEVRIKLSGLSPRQHVHFQSKHTDDKGLLFKATALYRADEAGRVDLGRHSSLGGSYTGVEPMGLFWSMLPESPHKKLLKRDASSPVGIDIEVLSEGGELLTRERLQRHLMADGVRRVPVRDGRLRGTIFIPPGDGPFPGILDMYLFGTALCEPRAALLANRGFVVFALAFFGYEDLPMAVDGFDLEYFEDAVTFLQAQPKVKTGIGVVGVSKSGDFALSIASFLPNIKATVCINTCNASAMYPLHYKGGVIPALPPDRTKITTTPAGILNIRRTIPDPRSAGNLASIIPVERSSCKFLFLASADDLNWNSVLFAEQACSRLEAHGKKNYELVRYPKAGHFLEVPYMPFHPSAVHGALGKAVAFGGEAKAHADAQVDAWRRIQDFLTKHLRSDDGCLRSRL